MKPQTVFEVEKVVGHTFNEKSTTPWYTSAWEYMKYSSLLIFHYESKFRQFCLIAVTSNEDIVSEQQAEESPEMYGVDNNVISQNFSMLRINSGKIIPKDQDKRRYSILFEWTVFLLILLS